MDRLSFGSHNGSNIKTVPRRGDTTKDFDFDDDSSDDDQCADVVIESVSNINQISRNHNRNNGSS